jgi:DNA-binding NtrC family response regulator
MDANHWHRYFIDILKYFDTSLQALRPFGAARHGGLPCHRFLNSSPRNSHARPPRWSPGWEAPGERAVGASDAWKDVMKRAALVAPTDATVLLTGESGDDLYYRRQLFDILLPPIRERRSDIPLLSDALLDDIGRSLGRSVPALTDGARRALLEYDWPGNVRELHNALERAAILSEGEPIVAEHLSLPPVGRSRGATSDLNVFERETIEQIMRDSGGNKSRAARRLGLTRTQLYVRLRKHHLENVVRS